MKHSSPSSGYRIGIVGAIMTIVGTLLSGPLSLLLVSLVQVQPEWEGVSTFVANYHSVQTLPFYFGFLLLSGSILMIASIYTLSEDKGYPLLALIFTSIACGLIFFNYITQTTVIPALVSEYSPDIDPSISILTMSNPTAIAWAIEMWGYGFLGLGTWLVADFFGSRGVEKVAKYLFVINGVLSLAGALWTSFDLGWVLSTAGLASFGLWNLLYVALAFVFYLTLKKRQDANTELRLPNR